MLYICRSYKKKLQKMSTAPIYRHSFILRIIYHIYYGIERTSPIYLIKLKRVKNFTISLPFLGIRNISFLVNFLKFKNSQQDLLI